MGDKSEMKVAAVEKVAKKSKKLKKNKIHPSGEKNEVTEPLLPESEETNVTMELTKKKKKKKTVIPSSDSTEETDQVIPAEVAKISKKLTKKKKKIHTVEKNEEKVKELAENADEPVAKKSNKKKMKTGETETSNETIEPVPSDKQEANKDGLSNRALKKLRPTGANSDISVVELEKLKVSLMRSVKSLDELKKKMSEMTREGKLGADQAGLIIRKWRGHDRQVGHMKKKEVLLNELSNMAESCEGQTIDDVKNMVNRYVDEGKITRVDAGAVIKNWKRSEHRRVERQLIKQKERMSARKRRAISLEMKKAIIEAGEKITNQTQLAKQFNVSRGTVQSALRRKEALVQAIERGIDTKRRKLRKGEHGELEEALVVWMKQARKQNIPVTGELTKEKAKEIGTLLNIDGFQASQGWLENFKRRNSITFKSCQGEAGAVDVGSLREWQQTVLCGELAKYDPNDVFNVDETALFWQLLPNKTMAFKGERCTNGKKSKERITVLVGANMTGTEKLPLLVIGKSLKPRCFKNASVPVQYTANRKAWMTSAVFETWLKRWDNVLVKDKRKVLLYIDNCSAHPPRLTLSSITIKFFPPNTTAISQPMDQGIIQNMKVHYRHSLLRERIKAIDSSQDFRFNLLNALHCLQKAWGEVKSSTVVNCFKRAGFRIDDDPPAEQEDAVMDELQLAWGRLVLHGDTDEDAKMEDYIHVDDAVLTDGCQTLSEIVGEVTSRSKELADSDSSSTEVEHVDPDITSLEALKAMDIVRRYAEKNFDNPKILQSNYILEDAIYQSRAKDQKQTKLTNFFR